MNQETGTLTPTPPFDFDKSLQFLGIFGPTDNGQRVSSHSLTKAITVDGQTVVSQLTPKGTIEEPLLEYTLFSAQAITETTRTGVVDRMTFFLSLTDDLQPFYHIGREDPDFAPIIDHLYGYHQVKFLTPFENACWAVLTQRNPMNIAQKMKQALIERFGSSLVVNSTTYWPFPQPIQAPVPDDLQLIPLVPNGPRPEYLSAI